jgi:hypothetical protein
LKLVPDFMRQGRRSDPAISLDDWASWFSYNGSPYGVHVEHDDAARPRRDRGDFAGLVQGAYKSNGVVFACMLARHARCSARRASSSGRSARAAPAISSATNATSRCSRSRGRTARRATCSRGCSRTPTSPATSTRASARPARADAARLGLDHPRSESNPDMPGWQARRGDRRLRVLARRDGQRDPELMLPEEVAHFAPIPDPIGALPRHVVADAGDPRDHGRRRRDAAQAEVLRERRDAEPRRQDRPHDTEKFKQWVELMREKSEGLANAYKTLYLGAGADATVVGANFRQIDFKATQGAGETRIAAAAGVPPIIVGLSEGLAAATYSNYGQARRRFADGTMRPLWRNAAGSLATIDGARRCASSGTTTATFRSSRRTGRTTPRSSRPRRSRSERSSTAATSPTRRRAVISGDLAAQAHRALLGAAAAARDTKHTPPPDQSKPAGGAPVSDAFMRRENLFRVNPSGLELRAPKTAACRRCSATSPSSTSGRRSAAASRDASSSASRPARSRRRSARTAPG